MSDLKSAEEIRQAVKNYQRAEAWGVVALVAIAVSAVAVTISAAYEAAITNS